MPEDGRLFTVSSEDDAFKYLEVALDDIANGRRAPELKLEGWPHLSIHLPATAHHSSITPSMMEAIIDYQNAIYRTQRLLDDWVIDLRSLSEQDRRLYELEVVVSEGSSEYDIDLTAIVTKLGGELIARMSPELALIGIITLAAIFAARSVWLAHIQARVDRRKDEVSLEERKAFLASQQFMGEQETKRLELLMRAKQAVPLMDDVDELAADGRQALVRGLAANGGGDVQGIPMSAELASELTRSMRQTAREEEITGVYEVKVVDTTLSDGFRIRLQDIGTGEEFFASLLDRMVSEEHHTAVRRAEWDKAPIRLRIRARRLRGKIVDAVILETAQALPPVG